MKILKRYRGGLIMVLLLIILYIVNKEIGMKAIDVVTYSFKEMLTNVPAIFILLGLLDVWISRETMIKYMGESSGLKGILLAIFIGSAAAGPLYGAFPIAATFMRKGVKLSNILIFIGAWSTTKIPMLLFEFASLGTKFALTRLLIDIPGIIIIGFILSKSVSKAEVEAIYANAEQVDS